MNCICGAPATTLAYWDASLARCRSCAIKLAATLDAEDLWPNFPPDEPAEPCTTLIDGHPLTGLLAPMADADQLNELARAMWAANAALEISGGVAHFTCLVDFSVAAAAVAHRDVLIALW